MKHEKPKGIKPQTVEEAHMAIVSKGLHDYDDLVDQVNHLTIEIAKAKDANRPYNELQRLKDEYSKLGADYEIAWQNKNARDKKITIIFLVSFLSVALVLGLLSLIMLTIFS